MRIRVRRRSFGLQLTVLLILGTVALARYWYNVGFDQKYRALIADELARYGLGAEIGRMTIDPIEGLTARDVRLFDLKFPEQSLAAVSRLSLDIDLGRLVNREDFLRSVTLTKADITLPVDPGDAETEWIRATNLNARLIIKGREIEIGHAEELPRNVARNPPGTKLPVTIVRSGQKRAVTATLSALADEGPPPAAKKGAEPPPGASRLGLSVSPARGGGVRVDAIASSSPLKDLRPGDVLLEVGGQPVEGLAELEAITRRAKSGDVLLAKIRRGGATRFAALPMP